MSFWLLMVEAGAPVTTSMLAARPVHRLVVQRPDYYRYRNRGDRDLLVGRVVDGVAAASRCTCLAGGDVLAWIVSSAS
jgi:hypothetical protein